MSPHSPFRPAHSRLTTAAVTFASFGLFAPGNRTVVTALFVSAISVSCAIFLVLELGSPFDGSVKVSGDPMRHSLSLLNR